MATILHCVSGSIAAYKAADLASKLKQAGHDVTVVMTEAAQRLVSPNTFLNLTGNRVFTDLWDPHGQTRHIALTDAADLCLVAPATANTVAKLALGLGDDMLSTTLLAVRCPVLVCPAMNTRMWEHPVVQENLAKLRGLGHHVLEPGAGNLACGHVGAGRLPEPAAIAAEVERLLAGATTIGGAQAFLELVTYAAPPSDDQLQAERAFRAEARARGALLGSARLGETRWAHQHRAETLAAAEALARRSPLAEGATVEVLPWQPEP